MSTHKSAIGIGMLTAIASSLCCITPLLAVLAGTTGFAATFQWVEPLRPYLIGLTILALGFAWYQQLKPTKADDCDCEVPKTSFFQGKPFLGIITVFAALMLTMPLYSKAFFPHPTSQATSAIDESKLQTVEFEVKGMTCGGCEAHVEGALAKMPGIAKMRASYELENTIVKFDTFQTTIADLEEAIETTSYEVVDFEIIQQ